MIQEKITADLRVAIAEKDTEKKDLLRVILAEMCRYTKATLCNTLSEIPILQSYLPTVISEEELTEKLTKMVNDYAGIVKNTGEKMKDAKALLGKDFDGKRVLNNFI